jgi:hypothetical protein
MARPVSTDYKCLKALQFFVKREVKAVLVEEAKKAGLSQSRYLERLLDNHLKNKSKTA